MAPIVTQLWQPDLAQFVIDAFERIQIFPPAITSQHIISSRRSANFVLTSWSNKGINLWKVDQVTVGLQPGISTYELPIDTLNLLDVYLRTYVGGTSTQSIVLGNPLTVMVTGGGDPMLTAAGEPVLLHPSSGVFSTLAGSQVVTMQWRNHGQSVGSPITFATPITLGAISVPTGTYVVTAVPSADMVQFISPVPAIETLSGTGGTPLLVAKEGSSDINVVLAGHGLSVGSNFNIEIPTVVGGIPLSGSYTVTALIGDAVFTISSGGNAPLNGVAFENSGQIGVTLAIAGTQFTDTLLWPISRNDYAALPVKATPGRPSIFWFDRTIPATVSVWPVPPPGSTYGLVAYRTKEIMDANPSRGQALDLPRRFYAAFVSALTAYLAEKYRPEKFQEKVAVAEAMWNEASIEDREKVSSYIVPSLSSYYR